MMCVCTNIINIKHHHHHHIYCSSITNHHHNHHRHHHQGIFFLKIRIMDVNVYKTHTHTGKLINFVCDSFFFYLAKKNTRLFWQLLSFFSLSTCGNFNLQSVNSVILYSFIHSFIWFLMYIQTHPLSWWWSSWFYHEISFIFIHLYLIGFWRKQTNKTKQ